MERLGGMLVLLALTFSLLCLRKADASCACPSYEFVPARSSQYSDSYKTCSGASAGAACECCSGHGNCTGSDCLCDIEWKERGCQAKRNPLEVVRDFGAIEWDGTTSSSLVDVCWDGDGQGAVASCDVEPGTTGWDTLKDRRVLLAESNAWFEWRVTVEKASPADVLTLARHSQLPVPDAAARPGYGSGWDYSLTVAPGTSGSLKLSGDQIKKNPGFLYLSLVTGNLSASCTRQLANSKNDPNANMAAIGCAAKISYWMDLDDPSGTAAGLAAFLVFVIGLPACCVGTCVKLGGPKGIKARAAAARTAAIDATDAATGAVAGTGKDGDGEGAEAKATAAASAAASGASAAAEAGGGACTEIVTVVLAGVLGLVARLVRAMFNVAIIWQSLRGIASIPAWADLSLSLENVFGPIAGLQVAFGGLLDGVNLVPIRAESSNCGGAVATLALLFLCLGAGLAWVYLRADVLLFVAIRLRRLQRGRPGFVRRAVKQLSESLTTLVLYSLQTLMAACGRLLVVGLSRKATCSSFDTFALGFSSVVLTQVAWLTIGPLLLWTFAGRVKGHYGPFGFLFQALANLTAVTLGWWTPLQEHAYEVVDKAKVFDDDPTDKDNQHATIVSLVGRSRGALWMMIPGAAIGAKAAEALNDPPGMVAAPGMDLQMSKRRRVFDYASNALSVVMTLVVALTGSEGAAVVLLLSLFPSWVTGLVADVQAVRDQSAVPDVVASNALQAAAAASSSASGAGKGDV